MRVRNSACWAALVVAAGLAAAAPPLLDPNVASLPDSSLVDFGALAPLHTTEMGLLGVEPSGHFAWRNGQRARFWGINVASESVFVSPERIAEAVTRIRRAGFNMVRLHHLDGAGGRGLLKGTDEPFVWDPDKLRCVDLWFDLLGKAGLSIYLDLLDYREFSQPGLGRAAKPYAVFDPGLIASQQRYARALLRDHVNPYTKLCYADDPTLALVELCDEHGLFRNGGHWDELLEPYRSALALKWNRFLAGRYGSTSALAQVWGGLEGQALETNTVALPKLDLAPPSLPRDAADKRARVIAGDAARFACQVHRDYFRAMSEFLRYKVGLKAPLTAIGDGQILPDLLAVAAELDFVGTNSYWDHPIFRAGRAWQLPSLFHYGNPVRDNGPDSFAPHVSLARMRGRPLVVREWNYCWPNPYRGAGMVEAASYAALQDIDAMLLFTYSTREGHRPLGYFDVQSDPARWGLAALCGALYWGQTLSPARLKVDIGYGELDTFTYKQYYGDVRRLAWVTGLANRCFDQTLNCDADLTIASGRSAAARYEGGARLLFRNDPRINAAGDTSESSPDLLGYPVALSQGPGGAFDFDGSLLMPAGRWPRGAGARFALRDLATAAAQPVGVQGDVALGFFDPRRKVAGFGGLGSPEQVRATLDLLHRLHGAAVSRDDEQRKAFVSDTGELRRDMAAGRLTIDTPRAAGVAGDLKGGPFHVGALRFETALPQGVLLVVSLDSQPLSTTRRFVAKMVGNAVNADMTIDPPGPANNPPDLWILSVEGRPPVRTNGRVVPGGWRVWRGDRLLFGVDQTGGAAEVACDGATWQWYSDTPGVKFTVPGLKSAQAQTVGGQTVPLPRDGDGWTWPAGAAVVTAAGAAP